jgi:GNAT superfamily N-acetyltransferase
MSGAGDAERKRGAGRVRVVEITDEREPLAAAALAIIADTFAAYERHHISDLRSEIAERRLGVLSGQNFHLLAAVADEAPEPLGAIIGVYLDGVNAGFVAYLGVLEQHRGRRVARILRPRLVELFREDARRAGHTDLAWVMGEVRRSNPWLRRLVRTRGAIPFDLTYYHPGMTLDSPEPYVLYRQPIGDARRDLPVAEVRRVLYSIYRRAYRVRYPLQRDTFVNMLAQLEGRTSVGIHPDFASLLS